MSILLLIFSTFSSASCIEAIPAQSLGAFSLGDSAPHSKIPSTRKARDFPSWHKTGGYRIHVNKRKTIDLIEFNLSVSQGTCFTINKKNFFSDMSLEKMMDELPGCAIDNRILSRWALVCDGLRIIRQEGKKPQVLLQVGNFTLAEAKDEIEALKARAIVNQSWRLAKPPPMDPKK